MKDTQEVIPMSATAPPDGKLPQMEENHAVETLPPIASPDMSASLPGCSSSAVTKEKKEKKLKDEEELTKSPFLKIISVDDGRARYRCEACWEFKDTHGKMCSYRGKFKRLRM